ncbi:MAG: hypothetical protein V3T64_10975 [Myxococcota bacterium]
MRGRIWIAGVVFWLGLAATAVADEYRSGFGFGISVPDVWLVLTQSEVAEHADIFLDVDDNSALAAIPVEMRRVVFERIQRGELEIFYRREAFAGAFVDNINIMRQGSPLPINRAQLDAVCRLLPAEFSRVFGRPISMDRCEMRELVGKPALYLQFDGALRGTKTMQYQLEQSSDRTLVITATATLPKLTRMLSEFEAMVASIRLD